MEPQENPSREGEGMDSECFGVRGCKGQGEDPVSTNVTYGKVRQLNCKLDNGSYEQNNQTDTNDKRIKHELQA